MKTIKSYLTNVNESVEINNNILLSIQDLLNSKLENQSFQIDINNIVGNNSRDNVPMGFESTDELLYDIAGYLVEVFVWNVLNNDLFTDEKFQKEWLSDVNNQLKGVLQAKSEFKPLIRRSDKGKYWDFELPGVNAKFEIKARSIKNGKSGGFRYSDNQKNDTNLIYIYVKYEIQSKSIVIKSIEVKKK